MTIDVPSPRDVAELSQHSSPGSVSIYVASGSGTGRRPFGQDTDAARLALRSAATHVLSELDEIDIGRDERKAFSDSIDVLEQDGDLWGSEARTAAIFVSPGVLRTFRLRNELPARATVGDRFDVGPLLRASTFGHTGYVLAITEGDVRLLFLGPDASSEILDLDTLPDDVAENLETTVTSGRFDRLRAQGTLGPKVEQRSYASAVQEAVLDAIGGAGLPLVLCAARDLESAYRSVNTYPGLLELGIDANPTSLSSQDLEARGRAVLDQHEDAELAAWRENFGTLRARGLASSQVSDIARAASAGLVDTLLFDLESSDEGSIDEWGTITLADQPGPMTYGLIDELAVRVVNTGGAVKAVRRADLPDDTAAAATFRGPL